MKRALILVFIFFLTGCAAGKSYRASSLFESYFDSKRTIAVMPIDAKMFQLTAGGLSELMDEWSEDVKMKLSHCIREELNTIHSVDLSFIDYKKLSEEERDFLKEQNGLYSAVGGSIVWHTYMPASTFKHKMDNFDYTLGADISRISNITQADTLLFCTARNYIWTAGRASAQAFSLVVGAFTGLYFMLPSGPELIAVSLIDAKTGDIIWFDYIPRQGDLREEKICKQRVEKLFNSLPRDI